MKSNLIFILLALVTIMGCNESYIVEETTTFENQTWSYSDTISYTFENKDTLKRYGFYLDITYDEAYYYQNIYLKIHTKYPSGKRITDQLGIDLAEKSGKSKGKCSGGNCTVPIVLIENVKLQELGNHTLTFEQFTREENLEGIKKLTFKVAELTKSEK
jgi:gliding motility-associated lipoprotein GldH